MRQDFIRKQITLNFVRAISFHFFQLILFFFQFNVFKLRETGITMESQPIALVLDDYGLEEVIIILKEPITRTEKRIKSIEKNES